jgi:polysaccharide deacetylase 2 family uncharacterized protein YibQ
VLLVGACLALIASVQGCGAGNRSAAGNDSAAGGSSTTVWPHGSPEFFMEIPEGYEGLLPEEAPNNGSGHGSSAVADASPGQEAVPDAAVEIPRSGSRLPQDSLSSGADLSRAIPYPLTVREEMSARGEKPALIIVIDDAGYNLEQLAPFLALPFPLTIAVLPEVQFSREAAERTLAAGKELILHQPMQALGNAHHGPGAVTLGMEPGDAARIITANLDSLPGAAGLNNHMGSAVTRDGPLMASVLELAKKRGIYYLDSLTVSGTATARLDRELSMPYWERDVFLDNSGDRQSILHALEEGKKVAASRGAAVLIGHVWSAELAQTLMDIYPQLVEEGYSLSTISRYMMKSARGDYDDARSGN